MDLAFKTMDKAILYKKNESHNIGTIYWSGIFMQDRIKGIQEAETIIDELGFITDFKQFSDLAICLIIEIEQDKVNALYHALTEKFKMDEFTVIPEQKGGIISQQIFFNISFKEGHGNLKVEVPSVPG